MFVTDRIAENARLLARCKISNSVPEKQCKTAKDGTTPNFVSPDGEKRRTSPLTQRLFHYICPRESRNMNDDIDQMHFLLLHIREACHKGDWNYKNVCSPFTRIYYVTKGRAQVELPGRTQDLHPDFMYVIPAFTAHSYVCRGEFSHYCIHVYKDCLIRIFKREMKMTPLRYINKKKMEKAQLRLTTESTPVKEMAYRIGFEDQAYFNRIFKRTTGQTPMNYRKSYHGQTP